VVVVVAGVPVAVLLFFYATFGLDPDETAGPTGDDMTTDDDVSWCWS